MSDDGLFPEKYQGFLQKKDELKGYEFQHAPQGSVAPPVVTFRDKLRWWTLDRWKRMNAIRAARDSAQAEIVNIGKAQKKS